jgi:hypothetical protein
MSAIISLLLLAGQVDANSSFPDPTKPAPRVRESRLDAIHIWNDFALDAIRKNKVAPPIAARRLAILHLAMADSVVTILPDFAFYHVHLVAKEEIDPNLAAASAAHRVLSKFHPESTRDYDAALEKAKLAVLDKASRKRAVDLGRYVADKMLLHRRDDGSDKVGSYGNSTEVGKWRPTAPKFAEAILPTWGDVAFFGVKTKKAFKLPPPPEIGSQEYVDDYTEVKILGGKFGSKRAAEQSLTAWFWDDGPGTCTPPGHWNLVAREVSLDKNLTLAENARLFALLNIALADAAVLCWDCKYRHRLWRPITAIRLAERDGNPETTADPRWDSLLTTPAFPSYVSGHSTFSGAASSVLSRFFDQDEVSFSIGSDGIPGTFRSYRSFSEAALEAGRSRIYGGIHFECDNREGLALGRSIAAEVVKTRLLPEENVQKERQKPFASRNTVSRRK